MNEEPRFVADVGRRVATIEGQLKGIERLLQKDDIPQALTQSAAVRNALESLVKVLLQASVTRRFELASTDERPEQVFERALERAMTYWFSSSRHKTPAAAADQAEFAVAAQRYTGDIQEHLRDTAGVLEKQDYAQALRELGAVRREVDELVRLAVGKFIKDRMAGRASARNPKTLYDRTVSDALKYWDVPDPQVTMPVTDTLRKKVLVVDDDPDVVDYVTYVLGKQAYDVVSAAGPEEAMRKVESDKPDLIILDVMMPEGTEGFHFTWRLRSRPEPEFRGIPIIVLTALHDTTDLRFYPEDSDGFYSPGEYLPVQGFIDKPVKEQDLLEHVGKVLRGAAREAEAQSETSGQEV